MLAPCACQVASPSGSHSAPRCERTAWPYPDRRVAPSDGTGQKGFLDDVLGAASVAEHEGSEPDQVYGSRVIERSHGFGGVARQQSGCRRRAGSSRLAACPSRWNGRQREIGWRHTHKTHPPAVPLLPQGHRRPDCAAINDARAVNRTVVLVHGAAVVHNESRKIARPVLGYEVVGEDESRLLQGGPGVRTWRAARALCAPGAVPAH
jgi:hypothetical protein